MSTQEVATTTWLTYQPVEQRQAAEDGHNAPLYVLASVFFGSKSLFVLVSIGSNKRQHRVE